MKVYVQTSHALFSLLVNCTSHFHMITHTFLYFLRSVFQQACDFMFQCAFWLTVNFSISNSSLWDCQIFQKFHLILGVQIPLPTFSTWFRLANLASYFLCWDGHIGLNMVGLHRTLRWSRFVTNITFLLTCTSAHILPEPTCIQVWYSGWVHRFVSRPLRGH